MIFILPFSSTRAILNKKGGMSMVKNRIGALRREAGLNQKELGQKLGVGQTTVSAWETGKNEPDHESLHKMAQMFHVSLGYLTGYEEDVDGRRGLSKEETSELWEERYRERERRRMQADFERAEQMDHGLTDEELEELQQDALIDEWKASGQDGFLETFLISKYFEYLTEAQRQRAVQLIELAFPNAPKGLYTDDTGHK